MHFFNKVFLMTALSLGLSASSSAQSLLSGNGTESAPYVISSKEDLAEFSNRVNGGDYDAWAIMTNDIDMDGITFTTIAPSTTPLQPYSSTLESTTAFTGHFDGQGHEIWNLTLEKNDAFTTMGLFGTVSGTVTRVGLTGLAYSSDTSGGFYGGIAGAVLKGGEVSQCYVRDAGFSSAPATRGFLVGANFGGTVSDCYAYCEWGQTDCMVGTNATHNGTPVNGKVQNSYCNMKLVGDTDYAGSVTESEGELTKGKFTGGYVAWKLNGGVTDGTQAWYQTLTGSAYSNNFPAMDKQLGTVYERIFCDSHKEGYTNFYNRTGHATLQYFPADIPTCYNKGHVAYWHCSVCGHDFGEEDCITDITGQTEIAARHTPTHYLTTPTCVTQGKATECWGCTVCGHWFSDAACTTEIEEPADGSPALGWLSIEGESGEWTHAMSGTYFTLCTETTSTEKSTRTITFSAPRDMEAFSLRYYLEQPGWASETVDWYPNIRTNIVITVGDEVRYSVNFGTIAWSYSGRDGWYDADLGHLSKDDKVVISITYEGASERKGEERASVTFHYKPLSHNLKKVERKHLVCLRAVEDHWECADCQQLFASDAHPTGNDDLTTLEALTTGNGTHNIVRHDLKEATCCTAGNQAYYRCDICNGMFSDSEGYHPYTTNSPALYPDNNATLATEGYYWHTTKRTSVMNTVLHNVAEIDLRFIMSEGFVPQVSYVITEDSTGDAIIRFAQNCSDEDFECVISAGASKHEIRNIVCKGSAVHDIALGSLKKGEVVYVYFTTRTHSEKEPPGRIYIGLEYTHAHQLTAHIPQGTATCIGDVTEHWTCASCGKNFLANEPGSDDAITTEPVIDESTAVADAHTFDADDRCIYCGLQTRHCEIGDTKIRLIESDGCFVANEDIVIADGDRYMSNTDFTAPKTTYRRTLPAADVWQAWYMPYDVEVSDLNAAGVEVAYLAGILYDEDENAFVAFLPMHSGTVSAHTPYVIKSADTRLVLETSDASFRRSDLLSPVTIQSAFDEFTFSGIFAPSQPTEDWYALNKQGNFQKVGASTTLQPYRIVLTIENRTDVPYGHSSSGQSSIRAMVLGEESATGITLYKNENKNIYDLQGQRVSNIRSGGVYIMNGKKYIAK